LSILNTHLICNCFPQQERANSLKSLMLRPDEFLHPTGNKAIYAPEFRAHMLPHQWLRTASVTSTRRVRGLARLGTFLAGVWTVLMNRSVETAILTVVLLTT
jgi:hypothetical protein